MFTHINSVYEILDAFSNKQPPRAARVLYAITLAAEAILVVISILRYTIIIATSSLIQAVPIKLAQRRSSTGCPSKKQPPDPRGGGHPDLTARPWRAPPTPPMTTSLWERNLHETIAREPQTWKTEVIAPHRPPGLVGFLSTEGNGVRPSGCVCHRLPERAPHRSGTVRAAPAAARASRASTALRQPDCRLPEPTPTTRFSPRCRNQGAGVPRASIRRHRPSILRAQLGPESRMGARFKGEGDPPAAAI